MLHHIDMLKDKVDGLNVTDNQSAVMRLGSLAVSGEIVRRGGDPIFQTTCRDRNRLGLQSDLLSAAFMGITNVLCLTGDHPVVGDHKQAKGVFDFDSVHLIQCCKKMNAGHDWAGNELDGGTDFFVGAVVTPESDPIEPQMYKFARKVEAGADFFQTQAVYDMDNFQRFMEEAREITAGTNVKIMAGLVVLTGVGMAKYMNRAVPGIFVPDASSKRWRACRRKRPSARAWRSRPGTSPFCVTTRSATAYTSWPSAKRRSFPRSSTWPA